LRHQARCDVGRRTPSTTAGPEIIKNIVALMLVTPSTPAPGRETPLISLQSSIP